MSEIDSALLIRLAALRRMVRARLILYGVVAVAAGGVFAFLTIVALDWLLRLPAVLRIVVAGFFLAGFVGATLHWIVRPWRARLDLRQIAGTLERYFGHRDDRLSSTVDFLASSRAGDAHPAGSHALIAKVISGTDDLVREMAFERALSLRPLLVRAGWLASGLALLAIIAWSSRDWPGIGLHRYLLPLSPLEWPRQVAIEPITKDLKVAFGESVTVRMRVIKGWHEELRGVVRLRDAEGRLTLLAMQREVAAAETGTSDNAGPAAGADYFCTIDGIGSDLTYWFEAGDDNTSRVPCSIRVVRRPEIRSTTITLLPPPYAATTPPRELDAGAGEVRAVIGSSLSVAVRAGKPLRPAADEAGAGVGSPEAAPNSLRFADGTEVVLAVDGADPQRASAQVEVTHDAVLRVHVTDRDGFTNRGGSELRVSALPDAAPTVVVVEPQALAELTPAGAVNLVARVEDDFGIEQVELVGRKIGGAGAPADSAPDGEFMIPLKTVLTAVAGADRVTAVAEHLWSVSGLQAAAGDIFSYQVRAVDNRNYDGSGAQEGRSPAQRLKIISEAELENRLRDEFALLQTRLRQALEEQESIKDETDRLDAALAADQPMTVEQQERASGLAARESRLAQRIRDLARQLEKLRRRIDLALPGQRPDGAAAAQQVQQLSAALSSIADGAVGQAVRGLEAARAASAPAQQRRELNAAQSAEQAALDVLRDLVRNAGAWGDLREVVNQARELFDRQQTLREQATRLGKQTVGKPVEELDPPSLAELTAQTRRQRQLADLTERLISQMQRLAAARRDQDPAAASALDAATRAAVAADIAARMREAAGKLESNRTAAAVNDQRSAEEGLAKMLAGLHERPARELAELCKRLERAEDAIARLLKQQRELLAENVEAQRVSSSASAFTGMVERQKLLRRNTAQLADELADGGQTADASRLVRRGVAPMSRAEDRLADADAPAAAAAQQEAVTALDEALALIAKLARQARHQASKASLAALRQELDTLRAQQQQVNDQTGEIVEKLKSPGATLQRADARRVVQLGRTQGTLREQCEALRQRLEETVVYEWILQRVVTGMSHSRERLEGRRLDAALSAEQREIVRALQRLADAITQTEALPAQDEFVEGSGGGGDGGQAATSNKPVPTVAELIVLRTLQEDLNARTVHAGADFDANKASEEQLQALQQLGDQQRQVKELTETVTQRARRRAE